MSGMQIFARTNHFRVRNLDTLVAMLKHFDITVHEDSSGDAPRVTLVGNDGDTGDFPTTLQVSEEMLEFAFSAIDRNAADGVDVAQMSEEEMIDDLRKRCDLEGFTASKQDLELIAMIVRADDPEHVEIDFGSLIAPYIADGEVAVIHQAGMEGNMNGPRSVFGYSIALINSGDRVAVDLYDVYKLAEQKFGVMPRYVGV